MFCLYQLFLAETPSYEHPSQCQAYFTFLALAWHLSSMRTDLK